MNMTLKLLVFISLENSILRQCSLFNCTFHLIQSRRLRWAGHVGRMEEGKSAFKMLTGNL